MGFGKVGLGDRIIRPNYLISMERGSIEPRSFLEYMVNIYYDGSRLLESRVCEALCFLFVDSNSILYNNIGSLKWSYVYVT